MTSKRTPLPGAGAVDAATGIARGAARTWVQTMMWGTRTSLRAARRLRVAATDREAAFELVHGAATGVRGRARDFLGVADLDERIGRLGLAGTEATDDRGQSDHLSDDRGPVSDLLDLVHGEEQEASEETGRREKGRKEVQLIIR